jgi:hypothetical protein
MTLEPLQRRVAAILKARRTPNSFVGGAAVLNETGPRVSDDLDIYAEDRPIAEIAEADIAALHSEGLKIDWRRDHYGFAIEAQVSDGAASTMLEWSEADQERFFPVQPHATFGWALHPLDLAVQKLLAAATRRQARDVCDLIEIEASGAPLAALALAAPAKFPGVSPEAMLQRARMNAMGLPAEDFDALRFDQGIVRRPAGEIKLDFADRVERAIEALAACPPSAEAGRLYLDPLTLRARAPTDEDLAALEAVPASRRGAVGRIVASPQSGEK